MKYVTQGNNNMNSRFRESRIASSAAICACALCVHWTNGRVLRRTQKHLTVGKMEWHSKMELIHAPPKDEVEQRGHEEKFKNGIIGGCSLVK